LGQLGVRRAVAAGEYLYRESDPGYDFYVVLSGAVEIVVNSEGKERVIARHGAGRFLGELNLLTGQRVFVSARVAEAGEVIAVPRAALRRLIATDASLSDKILAAFLARCRDPSVPPSRPGPLAQSSQTNMSRLFCCRAEEGFSAKRRTHSRTR
jgi:thioredoxin reductase (NADPH)